MAAREAALGLAQETPMSLVPAIGPPEAVGTRRQFRDE